MRKKLYVVLCVFFCFGMSYLSAQEKQVVIPFERAQDRARVRRSSTDVYGATGLSNLTPADKWKLLVQTLFTGPTEPEKAVGYVSPIPNKTRLISVKVEGKVVEVYLSKEFLQNVSSPDIAIEVMEHAVSDTLLNNFPQNQQPASVKYWIENTDGTFRPDTKYTIPGKENLPMHPPKYQPFAQALSNQEVLPYSYSPVEGRVPTTQPTGGLSGKRIGINPGHGWWYDPTSGGWTLQRPNEDGYIEDIGNWHRSLLYTARYLWNAGAKVFPSREWDLNTVELIFNNDNGAPQYTETGTWSSSGSGYNSTYRFACHRCHLA